MIEVLSQPWPWYVAGPLIGLTVALLLGLGGKAFGISSSLRHLCAATVPGRSSYLRYDWRRSGGWNLLFVAGILTGGFLAGTLLPGADSVAISEATRADLASLGIASKDGLVPQVIYGLDGVFSPTGFIILALGGFLVGFGARYAGGCTSGHAITGLATLQLASLIAVLGFFAGGLIATHLLLPLILGS